MNDTSTPNAFLSYERFANDQESGRITALFRERLSGKVRLLTGKPFAIFLDQEHIKWGDSWEVAIAEAISRVTFLIPILTPGFFTSPYCRYELEQFLARERRSGGPNLVFPVYYLDCDQIDADYDLKDHLAAEIRARQYVDWRALRDLSLDHERVASQLEKMAKRIKDAMKELSIDSNGDGDFHARSPLSPSPVPTFRSLGPPGISARLVALEPKTHIVDALHRGHFSRVSDAVQMAHSGDRLLIRSGSYSESIYIDKDIELIGEGDVVLQAIGASVITFRANMGRISNLTIQQMGGDRGYGIEIAQGRLHVEKCRISSRKNACVAVYGRADPRLQENAIYDGAEGGIFIFGGGLGKYENNDIYANNLHGVHIAEESNPEFRKNRIFDGKGCGVLVIDGGKGTFWENEITANAKPNVVVGNAADPSFSGNRIAKGHECGAFVSSSGRGTFENNIIVGNTHANVVIQSDGNPTFHENLISEGERGGVFVCERGKGTIRDNHIMGNRFYGIEVKSGGDPRVYRNQIYGNAPGGVLVNDSGEGVFEHNRIFRNDNCGVVVQSFGKPVFRRNTIDENTHEGLLIRDNGGGTFTFNDFRGNGRQPIWVAPGCTPVIEP